MKIGLVYTATNPQMCAYIEDRITALLGREAEWFSLSDASILQDVAAAGRVTSAASKKLLQLYFQAMDAGADVILNVCSSVGAVADAMEALNPLTGTPVVRIDSEMCRQVAHNTDHIAAIATFPTALEPTVRKIESEARRLERRVEISQILIDGGFGKASLTESVCAQLKHLEGEIQAVVLCQASMAVYVYELEQALNLPVYSSPDYGIREVGKAYARMQAQG